MAKAEPGAGRRRRRWMVLTAFAATVMVACGGGDGPSEPTGELDSSVSVVTTGGLEQTIAEMIADLSLSDEQMQAFGGVLASEEANAGGPGSGWYIAARLQEILTPEQVATLQEELPSRAPPHGTMRRRGGAPPERSAQRQEPSERWKKQRSELRMRRELAQSAMHDALGLTDEQITALRALRADRPASGGGSESREQRRAAAAAILTEAQRRTVVLHRALIARLMPVHRGDGPGDRGRRRVREKPAP
jgi:hypothetical protein